MTVQEIFQQAQALNNRQRKELAKLLIDSMDGVQSRKGKTGEEIAAMLDEIDPIEMVDSHIEDPVEWVKAQRRKRDNFLDTYRYGDES
ncbi:MAG: hypothetical protein ACPG7F_02830 [Aggregatilineales bacterium]